MNKMNKRAKRVVVLWAAVLGVGLALLLALITLVLLMVAAMPPLWVGVLTTPFWGVVTLLLEVTVIVAFWEEISAKGKTFAEGVKELVEEIKKL